MEKPKHEVGNSMVSIPQRRLLSSDARKIQSEKLNINFNPIKYFKHNMSE